MGKIAYMGQEYVSPAPDSTYAKKTDIATIERSSTASQNYAVGEYLYYNNQLYKVTTAITSGDTLVVDTNIEATTVGGELEQINSDLSVIGERVHNEGYTSYTVANGGEINRITIPKDGTYLFTAYIRGGTCWYTKNGVGFPDTTFHVATVDGASYAAIYTLEEGDVIAQVNGSGAAITYTASEMSAVRLK